MLLPISSGFSPLQSATATYPMGQGHVGQRIGSVWQEEWTGNW